MEQRSDTRASQPIAAIDVMTRFPRPGSVKTRMIPSLGPEGAAELHASMVRRTMREVRALSTRGRTRATVWFEGGTVSGMRRAFGAGRYRRQPAGDLGARMRFAIESEFARGAQRVIVVGTDCPGLDATGMEAALAALETAPVVLGPAADGGYYLVAVRADLGSPALGGMMTRIDWGTDLVLAQTIAALRHADVEPTLLETLEDVDRPVDLRAWEGANAPPRTLTVVIPALDEARLIATTVTAASARGVEVIVVDGGSEDGTADAARSAGATVVTAPRGRASQLNAGALAASGDALLFLHADTVLPAGYATGVLALLADPDVAAGAFSFATDVDTPTMRFFAWNTNRRARALGLPYGDQALFCRAGVFRSLGGFPEMPAMEDYEFVRRARRVGAVRILDARVVTSGRAWLARGVWRWTLTNMATVIAYRLGVPAWRLAAWRHR